MSLTRTRAKRTHARILILASSPSFTNRASSISSSSYSSSSGSVGALWAMPSARALALRVEPPPASGSRSLRD